MCACQGAFVCSKCRAVDDRDYELRFVPSWDELDAQARYDELRQAPDDISSLA